MMTGRKRGVLILLLVTSATTLIRCSDVEELRERCRSTFSACEKTCTSNKAECDKRCPDPMSLLRYQGAECRGSCLHDFEGCKDSCHAAFLACQENVK